MPSTPSPDSPRRPDARQDLPNPETALGGADSVPKTSYVTGQGTDPNARSEGPVAKVPTGGGINIGAIVLVVVVIAIALLFGGSLFR